MNALFFFGVSHQAIAYEVMNNTRNSGFYVKEVPGISQSIYWELKGFRTVTPNSASTTNAVHTLCGASVTGIASKSFATSTAGIINTTTTTGAVSEISM